MKCTRPRVVHDSANHEDQTYPCGKCPACRRSRTREWANRIIHELAYHKNAVFITLTYDDKNMPYSKEGKETLDRREFVKFIKRIRKQLEPKKIKYFACGEYGETYGRPHYHAILFNVSPSDKIFKVIRDNGKRKLYSTEQWPWGLIDVGSVTYKSAAYVAGYIQKKLGVSKYEGREPPFQLQSQGIGLDYVNDNKENLIEDLGFTMNGAKCSLPRYYRKKLAEDIKQERLNTLKEEQVDELDEFLTDRGYDAVNDRMEYKAKVNRMREKELKFKDEVNKHDKPF